MGDVIGLQKRRVRKQGDLYEVILPISIYLYAADIKGAGELAQIELVNRLQGLQYEIDNLLVRKSDLPHHPA